MATASFAPSTGTSSPPSNLTSDVRLLTKPTMVPAYQLPSYSAPAPRHHAPLLRPFHFVYTGVVNVLGFPSTQVPLGLSSRGLPLGVQVIAAHGNDHLTIAVACALEEMFGGWVPPPDPKHPGLRRTRIPGAP